MRRRLDWDGGVPRYVHAGDTTKQHCVQAHALFYVGYGANACHQIFPTHRVGPGVEMRADPVERKRRNGEELDMYTSLE
jgi:hypothetical protein